MKGMVLGIDTSCYTTSVACFGEAGVLYDGRTLLPVQKGGRGLRQSEGVFLHTRQLPPLVEAAFAAVSPTVSRRWPAAGPLWIVRIPICPCF